MAIAIPAILVSPPLEGPSRGLLRDCTTSLINRYNSPTSDCRRSASLAFRLLGLEANLRLEAAVPCLQETVSRSDWLVSPVTRYSVDNV